MKKIIFVLTIFLLSLVLVSCKEKPNKISNVQEFESLFEGAIKYDIRIEEECEDGHIKGFVCMGDNDNDEIVKNISLVSLSKDQNIVLIGEEKRVLEIFDALSKKGYKSMYYFDGGYQAYAQAKGEGFVPETGCGC